MLWLVDRSPALWPQTAAAVRPQRFKDAAAAAADGNIQTRSSPTHPCLIYFINIALYRDKPKIKLEVNKSVGALET